MSYATLLTLDQMLGKNSQLEIFNHLDPHDSEVSDLCMLLGADPFDYGIATQNSEDDQVCIAPKRLKGTKYYAVCDPQYRGMSFRPALPPDFTKNIPQNLVKDLGQVMGIKMVSFGTFPQQIDNSLLQHTAINSAKTYNFDLRFFSASPFSSQTLLSPIKEQEDTTLGKRFIVLNANMNKEYTSRNGIIKPGDMCAVVVEPIKWLVDPSGWWVAEKALISGISFDDSTKYTGNYQRTTSAKYLEDFTNIIMGKAPQNTKYFATIAKNAAGTPANNNPISTSVPPMEAPMKSNPTVAATQQQQQQQQQQQPVLTVTIDNHPMSITDQIKFYVQTGKSFMLHGPSGIGKTARVEAIDPDLTAIPLWNGVLPEDIVGKIRYPNGNIEPLLKPNESGEQALEKLDQGGVWVAPDWYNELCRKCTAEPDKQHVLFIDEVTNAKPTTQSLIFHIVLKKSISPSKGKLPNNAVVVLAGNEKEDSGAAYNMPAPLFRRMSGHIRLKQDLKEWMQWATKKSAKHPNEPHRQNVHPLVVQFLASNRKIFYTEYDEEEPKEDWAIDPRGWEQISDIIYDNKNVLRRELLLNKIGPEYTSALLQFARMPLITLENVLSGQYDRTTLPTSPDQRLAIALGLQYVDERNVGTVRAFIHNNLGTETLKVFDSVWIENNPERALYIQNKKGRER